MSRPPVQPSLAVVLQGFDQGGGVATSCLNQITILSQVYRIILFTDGGSLQPRQVPEGVVVQRLPVPELRWLHRLAHVPRQWVFVLAVRRALLGAGARESYAGVLFHSHPAAALLATPLRRRRIRSLLVVHGDIFDRPPGTYDWRLTAWYRWATPRAYRRVDAIISLSPAMVGLARRWQADGVASHLVPNCIDPAAIGLDAGALSGDGLLAGAEGGGCDTNVRRGTVESGAVERDQGEELLFVGRIEPVKGIDVLLDAVAVLHGSGRQLRLRCIGSVSPRYIAQLEQRIEELGLRSVVRLGGPQSRSRLGECYRRCLLLVVPSRSEPQATVILEGMAAGCAIVASDVGGNRMMLETERSGLLFPRDDLPALVRCLERLLDDPVFRQRLGAEARSRFHREFSRQALGPRLLEAVAASLE